VVSQVSYGVEKIETGGGGDGKNRFHRSVGVVFLEIYIYTYIERERERERLVRGRHAFFLRSILFISVPPSH